MVLTSSLHKRLGLIFFTQSYDLGIVKLFIFEQLVNVFVFSQTLLLPDMSF